MDFSFIAQTELEEIVTAMAAGPDGGSQFFPQLPTEYDVDLPVHILASKVAHCSNAYGRAVRLLGMAQANAKIKRGIYERKYKQSRIGKNDIERDRTGMESAAEEHSTYLDAESLVSLAEAIEASTRLASESSRKLLQAAEGQVRAQNRELKGSYLTGDFQTI